MTRYQHLATLLAERIEQGLYRHGEKLPSVRSLSQEHGVSISTVQQAYQTLETMKLIAVALRDAHPALRNVRDFIRLAVDAAGCRNAQPETALAGAKPGGAA